jgi:hypothetical protein
MVKYFLLFSFHCVIFFMPGVWGAATEAVGIAVIGILGALVEGGFGWSLVKLVALQAVASAAGLAAGYNIYVEKLRQ